jgi:1,6-anhydro-N-acetylmuramate kinase
MVPTLVEVTARAIARPQLVADAEGWIICGGGRHNPVIMKVLRSSCTMSSPPRLWFQW